MAAVSLEWEDDLDGGQMAIAGWWEVRAKPTGAYAVWRYGREVARGTAEDLGAAQAAAADRIAELMARPRDCRQRRPHPRRARPTEAQHRRPARTRQARLVGYLQGQSRTVAELQELLGIGAGAVYQAIARARRAGYPIRWVPSGDCGAGAYALEGGGT